MGEFICRIQESNEIVSMETVVDGIEIKATGENPSGDFTKECLIREKLQAMKNNWSVTPSGAERCKRCAKYVKFDLKQVAK